jgi:hypothetical protein
VDSTFSVALLFSVCIYLPTHGFLIKNRREL